MAAIKSGDTHPRLFLLRHTDNLRTILAHTTSRSMMKKWINLNQAGRYDASPACL